eukprot:CAMPEP_0117629924 /NCGR_PEP_ID=MMETSP0802-20121206/3229_1 /TAXON_ID=38833 /ORGANISM="Micromonas sp., Strain CCMP2099" /LENGTH=417 /DNA_ID=CAMNT_0005434175 /DNA_START=16 /DNA_END=1268 /DNA_ORIENTATION=-
MSHARQPFSRGAVVTGKAAKRSIVKHPAELNRAVDTRRVRWEIVKPWIATRVTELLTVEDDVLIAMIYNLLEQDAIHKTGVYLFSQLQTFLEKDTETFMTELWDLLVSANANPSGIPQRFIDEKANELRRQKTVADELRGRQRESDEKTAAARRDVKREVPVKTEQTTGEAAGRRVGTGKTGAGGTPPGTATSAGIAFAAGHTAGHESGREVGTGTTVVMTEVRAETGTTETHDATASDDDDDATYFISVVRLHHRFFFFAPDPPAPFPSLFRFTAPFTSTASASSLSLSLDCFPTPMACLTILPAAATSTVGRPRDSFADLLAARRSAADALSSFWRYSSTRSNSRFTAWSAGSKPTAFKYMLNMVLTALAMETCTLARSTGVSAASSSLRSRAKMGASPFSIDATAASKRSSCAL